MTYGELDSNKLKDIKVLATKIFKQHFENQTLVNINVHHSKAKHFNK